MFTVSSAGAVLKKTPTFTVWHEYPTVKIQSGTPIPTKTSSKVSIKAARSEMESFQIVISTKKDMKGISFKFTNLSGPSIIPADNITWLRVWYIHVDKPTKNNPAPVMGWVPDPLPKEEKSDIIVSKQETGANNNPFWITVKTPESAKAGIYSGEIQILQNEKVIAVLPLELELWDFSVLKRNYVLASGIDNMDIKSPAINKFMYEERMAPSGFETKPVFEIVKENGTINLISTAAFDSIAEQRIRDGGNEFRLPYCGWISKQHKVNNDARWMNLSIFLENGTKINPYFEKCYVDYIKKIGEHLRSKGWLKYFSVRASDEIVGEEEVKKAVMFYSVVKKAFPEMNTASTGIPYDSMLTVIDRWYIHPKFWSVEKQEKMLALGVKVYEYHNLAWLLDYCGIRIRAYAWSQFNRGLSVHGEFRYAVDGWKDLNPWNNIYIIDRNGPGYAVYPPRNEIEKPIVTSMRLEIGRESVEDWEYLYLLKKRIAYAEANGGDPKKIAAAKTAFKTRFKIASKDKIWWFNEPYPKDSEVLYKIREEIAYHIVQLGKNQSTESKVGLPKKVDSLFTLP
jgi:hypothetical protein